MIEVEVRSLLLPDIAAKLEPKLGMMRLHEQKTSQDIYFDTPNFDLLLHPQAVFVRLREGHLLQFKFDESQEQAICIEREFMIPAGNFPDKAHALFREFLPAWQTAQTWEGAIESNHLVELARIEKKRSVYIDGPLIISIDQVQGLGNFVEIERNCVEGTDVRAAEEHVYGVLHEIGGIPLKAGYFEMWLYRKNSTAYQLVPPQFRVEENLLNFL